MKNLLHKTILVFGLVLFLNACTDQFEDVNTDPNSPETATPDLLVPRVIREPIYEWASKAWNYGNVVMQYTAKIQFTNEDRYNWGPQTDPWRDFYNALRDISNLDSIASQAGQSNYVGLALVMKSWMYSILTDTYGDIPYAEATLAKGGVFSPQFDTQEEVYQGVLQDLERANSILGSTSESINGDILFHGDILRWRKFANSLRLRIHMRLSNRIDPSNAMQAILDNPTANPIFESNAEQAAVQFLSESPNQQPLYTTRSGSFDEFRLSENMETVLKDLGDPRLFAYAQPTSDSQEGVISTDPDDYQGVPNGLADEEALQYSPSGDPLKGGSNFVSRVGLLYSCRACDPLASPIAAQAMLMSYTELQFILAEARERGFITSGDAETYYQNGMEASFDYYESRLGIAGFDEIVAVIQPGDSYFQQGSVVYTGTTEEKLAKIGLQKWIALFFHGMEAWFDWRRTGFPAIAPGPANVNNDRVPVRFMYPTDVQALNRAEYEAAVSQQGADDLNTRVWWDVD